MDNLSKKAFSERFEGLWNGLEESFFKFEALQRYDEGENEAFREMEQGNMTAAIEKLARMFQPSDYEIDEARDRDFSYERIRLVERPLSDYTYWEFHMYKIVQKLNKPVYIVEQEDIRAKNGSDREIRLRDFLIFDDSKILVQEYSKDGILQGASYSDSEKEIEPYIHTRDLARKVSIPFSEYVEKHSIDIRNDLIETAK